MKKLTLLFTLIFCSVFIYSQQEDSILFDEFTISINRTNLHDLNTEDRFGIGVGAYHIFRPGKRVNLIYGLELNRTSQFMKSIYEGRYAVSSDVTYTFVSFSSPLIFRLNIGNSNKVYLETGGYVEINWGKREGTMKTWDLDETYNLVYDEFDFDEKLDIKDPNIGVSLGMGLNIPISKYTLMIKPEYKFGLFALHDYMDQVYNRYFRLMIGIKI